MSKRATALIATLFAAGTMATAPAWADRGYAHFDRRDAHFDRHDARFGRHDAHFERGRAYGYDRNAWGWGLGLLAGSAILLAASQPRPVVISPPVQVYRLAASPSAAYSPSAVQWWYYCAQSGGYYPNVNYCPSGWTKVPATPLP